MRRARERDESVCVRVSVGAASFSGAVKLASALPDCGAEGLLWSPERGLYLPLSLSLGV